MKFRPVTKTLAQIACLWFKSVMKMEDWKINVTLQDEPPPWVEDKCPTMVAYVNCWVASKTADVWLSNYRCQHQGEEKPCDPLESLIHEFLHCALRDVEIKAETDAVEGLLWRLERILGFAFRRGLTSE